MIGVFLKEFRENVKWAAVMCGVMLFMFYREMRDGRPFMMFELAQRYTVA